MTDFHELDEDQKLYGISPYLGDGRFREFVDEGDLVEDYDEEDIASLLSKYDFGYETLENALANDNVATTAELNRWGTVEDYEINGTHYYLAYTSMTGDYGLWALLEDDE